MTGPEFRLWIVAVLVVLAVVVAVCSATAGMGPA